MNVEQAIKALYDLKIKDKMSDTQREQLRILLSGLLLTPEGVAGLREHLTPTILFSRKITQSLIEEIQRLLERNEAERPDSLLRLLTYIAHGDKIDSASLWLAISVYLRLGPADSPRLLAEVLDTIPGKDLEDRYEKYGYPFLNPDGGLPYLLALALDLGTRPYPWLSGLIERVANRVWKSGQIADLSLQQVQTYLTRLSQTNPVRFMRADRPLLLLAMAHMERGEGLRALLETLLQALPAPDPNDQTQRDWRPIIAQRIKERLENKPSPLPPPPLPPRPTPPEPVAELAEPEAPAAVEPASDPVSPSMIPRVPPPTPVMTRLSPTPVITRPSPMFSSPVSARTERPPFKTAAPEPPGVDVEQCVQQLLQDAERLRAFGKEYTQMKDMVKNLEEQLTSARDTIESLEAVLKEKDRKLTLVQAKLSASQEQFLMTSRRVERLQKQQDQHDHPQEAVMEPQEE